MKYWAIAILIVFTVPFVSACKTTPLSAKAQCEKAGGVYKGKRLCEFSGAE